MSSAESNYFKNPVVIFHLLIISISQRLITWPLKMNSNDIMPTSVRHDCGWAALDSLKGPPFLLTGLGKKDQVD